MIKKNYDWAIAAELIGLRFNNVEEGTPVRMTGQDVKRGTFSHIDTPFCRDAETNEAYNSNSFLITLKINMLHFRIHQLITYQSMVFLDLNLATAMATSKFSYVLWEAQFGDFANGAQVMMDQFISSSESKWQRNSGLVMLLPHGYEGQGPEHSSARLERYLQLCAEFNMTVANVTKPANFFHLLRRQLERPFRKPLIVMSPKKLLRYPECVSPLEDFGVGEKFQEVYGDPSEAVAKNAKKVRKVLWCSGKVYYDLLKKQQEDNIKDIAICRIEQLYPFPHTQFDAENAKYPKAEQVWVQEEPENMGAWQYVLSTRRKDGWDVVSRKASASPATGYKKAFEIGHEKIMAKAFE